MLAMQPLFFKESAATAHEPTIQELQEASFVAVGQKYGVSDNAIRKWLRNEGINPKDIKSHLASA